MRKFLAVATAVLLLVAGSAHGSWPEISTTWRQIQDGPSSSGSSVPAPSLPDAGKVPVVNAGGTAYELATVSGTGTVTSVTLTVPSIFAVTGSPITTTGTFGVTLATQAANTIFAGPATGADAAPTFRALVAADLGSFTLSPSLKLLTLQDAGADTTPLTVRASGGAGTAHIAQFQTSANGALSHIAHDGTFVGNVTGNASTATAVASVVASKLVGRGSAAGDGASQDITVGTGLTMTGTTLSATGGGGGITNSAGANVVVKSDGTNVVASSITDNGTTLTLGNAGVTVTEATGAVALTAQAAGTVPLTVTAASGQTANLVDVKDVVWSVSLFKVEKDGSWSTAKASLDKKLYWTFADAAGSLNMKRGASTTGRYFNVFDNTLLTMASGDGSQLDVTYTGHIIPKADNTTGKAAWGADAASPQAITHVLSAGGLGTNVAGARANIYSGSGTGSAVPGVLAIQSGFPGASGTTANTPSDRDFVGFPKTLTESSATGVLSIAVAAGTVTGGTFYYTIEANDGTDFQSVRGRVDFAAVNKAGTLTLTLGTPVETTAVSAGTLTNTVTLTAGTNAAVLNLNAVSSLTQTTLRATPRLALDGGSGVASPL